MVEAAVQGKSQVPVELKFDLLQRPVQGQPLEIAIALLPQIAARSATIAVTGSDGLQLEPADDSSSFPRSRRRRSIVTASKSRRRRRGFTC